MRRKILICGYFMVLFAIGQITEDQLPPTSVSISSGDTPNSEPTATEEAVSTDSPAPFSLQGCNSNNGDDCGPYTFKFCEICLGPNSQPCQPVSGGSSGSSSTGFTFTDLHSELDKEPSYSTFQILRYKMLELEFAAQFLANPTTGIPKVDLPHCGLPARPSKRAFTQHLSGPSIIEKREPTQRFNESPIIEKRSGWGIKIGKTKLNLDPAGSVNKAIDWVRGDRPPTKPDFSPPGLTCIPTSISVPVRFIVVTTNGTTNNIATDDILNAQLQQLNHAFQPLKINFVLESIKRQSGNDLRDFTNQQLSPTDDDYIGMVNTMKSDTRLGGQDALNVWIVEAIDNPTCKPDGGVDYWTDGYCEFPQSPPSVTNGCVVILDSLPGVTFRDVTNDRQGTTLIHEVGHWFGLHHVFPDPADAADACSPDSDGIDGTYQYPRGPPVFFQSHQPRCCYHYDSSQSNKPIYGQCPGNVIDHVINYMSYSVDKGQNDPSTDDPKLQTPWHETQRAAMYASYFTFRRFQSVNGLKPCDDFPLYENDKTEADFPHLQEIFTGRSLLNQPPGLIENLQQACAVAFDPDNDLVIDGITGVVEAGPKCNDLPGGIPCVFPRDRVCADGSPAPCPGEGKETSDTGTNDPGTNDPGTGTGTASPGTDNPGTENPGGNDPGTGTANPGTDNSGTENPGGNDPGTNNPGTNNPGSSDPNNPGTNNPVTNNPGTNNPGTNNPGTNNPSNSQDGSGSSKSGGGAGTATSTSKSQNASATSTTAKASKTGTGTGSTKTGTGALPGFNLRLFAASLLVATFNMMESL